MAFHNVRLKELRKSRHLSQSELANHLGLGKSTISMYESGQRTPEFVILESICDFFNVNMAELSDTLSPPVGNNSINITGNNNAASINGGSAVTTTTTTTTTQAPNHCNDVMQALFGHSKEAMEVLKHIRIDSQGNISNIDVTDKATIKALAETMILQLKAAQARADSKITVPAK